MTEQQKDELTWEEKLALQKKQNEEKWQQMKEQWKQVNENWKNMPPTRRKLLIGCAVFFILIYLFIGVACIPKIKTGYTKTPITIQTGTNSVRYEISDPIEIADNDAENYNVYKDGKKIGTVNKTDIAFADTPEYEQAKKDRITYDNAKKQFEEELKKEQNQAVKKFEEAMNEVFYKVTLKPEWIANFYIKPLSWQILQFDQKKQLFKNCVMYTAVKFNIDESKAESIVKIKNSANEETLAEYAPFSGIKIK